MRQSVRECPQTLVPQNIQSDLFSNLLCLRFGYTEGFALLFLWLLFSRGYLPMAYDAGVSLLHVSITLDEGSGRH